jgi:hypothetical protein
MTELEGSVCSADVEDAESQHAGVVGPTLVLPVSVRRLDPLLLRSTPHLYHKAQ